MLIPSLAQNVRATPRVHSGPHAAVIASSENQLVRSASFVPIDRILLTGQNDGMHPGDFLYVATYRVYVPRAT